jgi:peptidoglycan hydrolase CwlO-like protein
MKYGIYKGDIVEVSDTGGLIVTIQLDGDPAPVSRSDIIEIAEDHYKEIEPELKAARQEISNIKGRIYRLEEEYNKKNNALHQLMMEARQKEIAVTNRLFKKVKID